MDDKEALCFAMDCESDNPTMRNTDNGTFAGYSTPVEHDPSPPTEVEPLTDFTADDAALVEDPVEDATDDETVLVQQVIEALLFSSDVPLSAARLADLVEGYTPAGVRTHIEALNQKYARAKLSFRIEAIARGYQMMTLPDFRDWIVKLNKQRSEARLSAAALETLSIIAYKQPTIRAEVEAVRGVACGEVISRLRDMGLIRILGRAEIVGRPLLYGTTKKFLNVFGLADIEDLPPMEALQLKSASKPVEEVEPIKPPPIPEPPMSQVAAAGG